MQQHPSHPSLNTKNRPHHSQAALPGLPTTVPLKRASSLAHSHVQSPYAVYTYHPLYRYVPTLRKPGI